MSDWLNRVTSELRGLGFFAGPPEDDTAVAAELAELYQMEWGHRPSPGDPLVELELARYDSDRVWWEDTEADVGMGTKAYVELINGLSRISRGTFEPIAIEEFWTSPAGPIRIRVDLPDRVVELAPDYLDDYLDIDGILSHLNARAPVDGPLFARLTTFDQTAFVVCLTVEERRALEERGWSFSDDETGTI